MVACDMDFAAMAELCAPNTGIEILSSIVSVESSFNPYAIGVVGARLERQPVTLSEAIATADQLRAEGYNYSLGLAQINRSNFSQFGLSHRTAFDPCINLRAGAMIFEDCYRRAGVSRTQLTDALSCYYSGNFTAGYSTGYVAKVLQANTVPLPAEPAAVTPIAVRRAAKPSVSRHPRLDPAGNPAEALLTMPPAASPDRPLPAAPATALLF